MAAAASILEQRDAKMKQENVSKPDMKMPPMMNYNNKMMKNMPPNYDAMMRNPAATSKFKFVVCCFKIWEFYVNFLVGVYIFVICS